MKKQLQQVAQFHRKIGSPVLDTPTIISNERVDLRYRLMKEELDEYFEGAKKGNLVNTAKELADILVTVYGTILEHGLQGNIEEIFNEVQRSNMTKQASSGKAIKGKEYEPANVEQFFE